VAVGARVLWIGAFAACGRERSVTLFFPNDAALASTERVTVDAYGSDVCAGLVEALADQEPVGATPLVMATFTFPFDSVEIEVPSSAREIVARAFAESRDDPPFLAGCTDRFEPEGDEPNIDLLLRHVPYPTLTLVAASGHRQVGRPGELLPIPLAARAQAVNEQGRVFPIPGIEVRFRLVAGAAFTLGDGRPLIDASTGADGIASVGLTLPSALPPIGMRTATVIGMSPAIADREVALTAGVAAEIELAERTIPFAAIGAPSGLAAGRITGDRLDLVVAGASGLSVVIDPLGASSSITTADVGVAPVGAVAADVIAGGRDEIAVANARRAASEGAELRIFRYEGASLRPIQRYVMTGSNAVGLAAVRTGEGTSIAIATSGRSESGAPCSPPGSCQAMCPPGELCGPESLCVAADDLVVLFDRDRSAPGRLAERGGCHRFTAECDVIARTSSFDCDLPADSDRSDMDDCGCEVLAGIRLGAWSAPAAPRGIAAASLLGPATDDLVIPTVAGLAFFEQQSAGFTAHDPPTLQHASTYAATIDLNGADDPLTDVLWIEPGPCVSGPSIDAACPLARPPPPSHAACLGVYQSDGATPVYMIEPPKIGECRRHGIPFVPSGLCAGDLDGDGTNDVVILDPAGAVNVYSGDGTGGLLDPPAVSPVSEAGPMICVDLDEDGTSEVVVAGTSDRLHILAPP
jgi:hypothetical protein